MKHIVYMRRLLYHCGLGQTANYRCCVQHTLRRCLDVPVAHSPGNMSFLHMVSVLWTTPLYTQYANDQLSRGLNTQSSSTIYGKHLSCRQTDTRGKRFPKRATPQYAIGMTGILESLAINRRSRDSGSSHGYPIKETEIAIRVQVSDPLLFSKAKLTVKSTRKYLLCHVH